MCGIVAVLGSEDAWGDARRGLLGLQHRGQQGAKLVGFVPGAHPPLEVGGPGLVAQAIPADRVVGASVALGHTRYATTGDPGRIDQPFVGSLGGSPFALAHNGQVRLRSAGRALLERAGQPVDASVDSLWLVRLIEAAEGDLASRVARLPEWVDGAFALVVATADEIVGARDRHGLRPLFLGRGSSTGALVLASEPVSLAGAAARTEAADVVWDRALAAGEIVSGRGGAWQRRASASGRDALCLLETVYFAAGPTRFADGPNVERRRELLGEALAAEAAVEADVVVGVPTSGSAAARGYARIAGLPLEEGLSRRASELRSFLAPDAASRSRIVQAKLAVQPSVVAGRRVVIVDDSVVRGTTSRIIAGLLREAGAKEVHLRLSSPAILHPCFFGVDMPSRDDLAAARHGASLPAALGYDSVAFLSLPAARTIAGGRPCDACFSGRYPDVDTSESAVQCAP